MSDTDDYSRVQSIRYLEGKYNKQVSHRQYLIGTGASPTSTLIVNIDMELARIDKDIKWVEEGYSKRLTAFVMGSHSRLGEASNVKNLDHLVVKMIIDKCRESFTLLCANPDPDVVDLTRN